MDTTTTPSGNDVSTMVSTPWALDLSDARYDWPQSFSVGYAARAISCWLTGALPQYVQVDPPVFAITGRQWQRLSVADIATVCCCTLHAERALLRLPEAIVRARHALDAALLEDVASIDPAAGIAADTVAFDIVREHAATICAMAQVLDTCGAMDAHALALFACEHGLLHRQHPMLLDAADEAADEGQTP